MSRKNEKTDEIVVPQQEVEQSPVSTIQPPATTTPVMTTPAVGSVPITEWIITFFLLMIPLLNLILLILWAFSSDTNPSKANFAKAYLIIFLIVAALTTLAVMLFGATVWTLIQSQGGGLF